VLPLSRVLKTLEKNGKMTRDLVDTVKSFIAANQTGPNASGGVAQVECSGPKSSVVSTLK
jgi:hypothetical protein